MARESIKKVKRQQRKNIALSTEKAMVDLNSSQYSQVTKIYRTVNKEKAAEIDEESNIKVKTECNVIHIYRKEAKRRPTKKDRRKCSDRQGEN